MEKKMEASRPQEGDIVQVRGHGRGMLVVNDGLGLQARWEGIPDAVVCEWHVKGVIHREGFAAGDLEVVGSRQRQSHPEIYGWITAGAVATITDLVAEGLREQALGAMRMWSETVGVVATDEDRLRLQQLVDRVIGSPQ